MHMHVAASSDLAVVIVNALQLRQYCINPTNLLSATSLVPVATKTKDMSK